MKIFAIGDLHLSFHETVDKSMEAFGEGWEDYENRLRTNWLQSVLEEDLVILPGDLSWGLKLEEAMPDLDWIHELPGRKVAVKGNHDLWWHRIGHLRTLYDDLYFLQNDSLLLEDTGIAVVGTRGWMTPGAEGYTSHDEKIYQREQLRLQFSLEDAMKKGATRIIAALHYPPAGARNNESAFTALMEQYPVTNCVYGHLHGMVAYGSGIRGEVRGIDYRLVSLDYLGAKPKLIIDTDVE